MLAVLIGMPLRLCAESAVESQHDASHNLQAVCDGASFVSRTLRGRDDEHPWSCTFANPAVGIAAHSLACVALMYNVYAFWSVHRLVRRSLASIETLLDGTCDCGLSEEVRAHREAAQRRLRLWPRFVAYSAAFVITQLPASHPGLHAKR
jgi:hypothetical protein